MPKWAIYVGAAAVLAYFLLRPRTAVVVKPATPPGAATQIGNLVDGVVKLFQ